MSLGDTDWRPDAKEAVTRRIGKPQPVEFYVLRNWDGGSGTSNRPNGFIVSKKELADEWTKGKNGCDYQTVKGILVQRLEDIPEAQEALKRQKALDKLTEEEKKLLGLA